MTNEHQARLSRPCARAANHGGNRECRARPAPDVRWADAGGIANVSEQSSLALTIDLDVGKVRIGSCCSTPITNKEGDAVTFGRGLVPSFGEPTGSVNRLTGQVSVNIMTLTDGEYRFYGACKRAVPPQPRSPARPGHHPLAVSVVERGAGASSFPVSQKVLIAKVS
jgi:hypothetical protein